MNNLTAIKEEKAVVILDGLNFLFYEWQIGEALFLWESGVPLREMVNRLRPLDNNLYQPYAEREAEVFLLLLHLSLDGKLKKRPGGVYGSWKQTRVEDYKDMDVIEAWNRYVEDSGGKPEVDYMKFKRMVEGDKPVLF